MGEVITSRYVKAENGWVLLSLRRYLLEVLGRQFTTINPNSDGSVAQSLEGNIWATGKEFGFGKKDGLKIHL